MNIKKTLAALALAAGAFAPAAAQEVMTVYTHDGGTQAFRVDNVKEVTFGQISLSKQYDIDGQLHDIASVLEWKLGTDDTYTNYLIYPETTTAPQDVTPLSIRIANDKVGTEIDLATAGTDDVEIVCPELGETESMSGTLKVAKDRLGSTLTISLDATVNGKMLAAAYKGSFAKGYYSSNHYTFTPYNSEDESGDVTSVFRVDDATGTFSEFCFGSLDAATPDGLTSGNYAVIFQLPTSMVKNGGTIDLKESADSYKLRFIDFKNNKSYTSDELTTGSITFHTQGSKVYFDLDATLVNGVSVTAEFYGATIAATTFESIIPAAGVANGIRIYDADGETVTYDKQIGTLKVRDKSIGGGQEGLWLYFLPEDETSTSDQLLVPLVKINKNLINAGETDLTEAEAYTYAIKFKDFQLQSPDNEWVNVGQKGTIEVSQDGDNYTINITVYNKYKGPYATGGDGTILMIQYTGAGTAY